METIGEVDTIEGKPMTIEHILSYFIIKKEAITYCTKKNERYRKQIGGAKFYQYRELKEIKGTKTSWDDVPSYEKNLLFGNNYDDED